MGRSKTETQYIHCFSAVTTGTGVAEFALVALSGFLFAVNITRQTEAELQVIFFGLILAEMIHHHTRILDTPLRMFFVTVDHILNGTRDLLLFLVQQIHLFLHDRLLVSHC